MASDALASGSQQRSRSSPPFPFIFRRIIHGSKSTPQYLVRRFQHVVNSKFRSNQHPITKSHAYHDSEFRREASFVPFKSAIPTVAEFGDLDTGNDGFKVENTNVRYIVHCPEIRFQNPTTYPTVSPSVFTCTIGLPNYVPKLTILCCAKTQLFSCRNIFIHVPR
jgi:hypothetical protein